MQDSKKLYWIFGILLSINFLLAGFFIGSFYEKSVENEKIQKLEEENNSLVKFAGKEFLDSESWRNLPNPRENFANNFLSEKGLVGKILQKKDLFGVLKTKAGLVRISFKDKDLLENFEIGDKVIVFGELKNENFGKVIIVNKIEKV